ncbi:hypothetical protein AA313_de0201994 [Arthrobotrys entomopaga]|nr:hypothetical protein AA313_de0201994 [Arthrobotrys entomopaga]
MSTRTIHDLAWEGTLTEEDLLEADRLQAINDVHSQRSLTPLGAAVLKGHVSTTRLLLQHKADVNKPSGTRTPLWIAVSKMQKEKNIALIVKILLEAGADPNVPSTDDNNSAPLLNAVKQNRKPEVITMLVDRGASLTAEDGSGMSAERFAKKKGPKIQSALFANSWRMDRYKAAGMVTGLVLFVVAWSNTTPSQRRKIAQGAALLALLGMGGAAAISASQRIDQPTARLANRNTPTKDTKDKSTQPATEKNTKAADGSQSATDTAQATSDSTQPTIDNTADSVINNPINSTNSAISELSQSRSSGVTQPAVDNTTKAAISEPAPSTAEHITKAAVENPDISRSTINKPQLASDSTDPELADSTPLPSCPPDLEANNNQSTTNNVPNSVTNNSANSVISEPINSSDATHSAIDDTTKATISDPVQSAISHPAGAAVENSDIGQSATNTTEAISDDSQSTTSNTTNSTRSNSVNSVITEPIQSSGATQPATDDTTKAAICDVLQPVADDTNRPADTTAKPPIDATSQNGAENIAEPATSNGDQARVDEATEPAANDIEPANNNAVEPATDDDDNTLSGAIHERFGMSGEFGDEIPPELKELMGEENVEQFKKGIDDYITRTNLNRFFPPDNPFLKTVVRKALELEQDPENTLNVKDLTKLSLYQTVLYLDDSGSMRKGTRQNDLRDLVRRIASIATRLLPDGEGVELRFINSPTDASYSKPSLDMIDNIISTLRMWGWTPIGTNLKAKILIPLVYKQLRAEQLKRPMLVSIITDGFPEGPQAPQGRKNQEKRDSLKEAILECKRRLQQYGFEPNAVLFQISQIGPEEEATLFLESLRLDEELDDVLYCSTDQLDAKYKELQLNHQRLEQFLFSTLLGPIIDANPT